MINKITLSGDQNYKCKGLDTNQSSFNKKYLMSFSIRVKEQYNLQLNGPLPPCICIEIMKLKSLFENDTYHWNLERDNKQDVRIIGLTIRKRLQSLIGKNTKARMNKTISARNSFEKKLMNKVFMATLWYDMISMYLIERIKNFLP